jgi:hypothetical protein
MLDVAVSYNRFKFLGYEFLTWLWYSIENEPSKLRNAEDEYISLNIGNRIVLQNRISDRMETITIKGDDAGLEEGMLSLQKGAVVTELNLSYKEGDQEWNFTVKGESLNIANLKIPDSNPIEFKEDIEGLIIEKAFFYHKVIGLLDALYKRFIHKRVSPEWNNTTLMLLRRWIHS